MTLLMHDVLLSPADVYMAMVSRGELSAGGSCRADTLLAGHHCTENLEETDQPAASCNVRTSNE